MTHASLVAVGLTPDNEQARQWARDELSKREYHPQQPGRLSRIAESVAEWFGRAFSGLSDLSQPLTIIFWIIVAAIVTAIIVYVSRFVRRTPRSQSSDTSDEQTVLGAEAASAKQFRGQARKALDAGDFDGCIVAATRALTRRAFERRLLDDAPSLTAHEVAAQLSTRFPEHVESLLSTTDLFDAVVYGDRHATATQARSILDFESELSSARPSELTSADDHALAVPR